jgi:hypothetical protein
MRWTAERDRKHGTPGRRDEVIPPPLAERNEHGMDVSTARHPHPDPNLSKPVPLGPSNGPVSADRLPGAVSHPLSLPLGDSAGTHVAYAPVRPRNPLRHAILVGTATMASVALTLCCVLSVSGLLWPSRRYLSLSTILVSVVVGIYFGIQAWVRQRQPGPISVGRCLDCGTELYVGAKCCPLCGRKI